MDEQVDAFLQSIDSDLTKQPAPSEPAAAPAEEAKPRERKRRRFEAAPPPVLPQQLAAAAAAVNPVQAAAAAAAAAVLAAQKAGTAVVPTTQVMTASGDFAEEVEINDCPNRTMLTRGEMHREITDKTGAAVMARGEYVEPGAQPTAEGGRKLHLRVTASSQAKLDDAIELIKIKMDLASAPRAPLPEVIEEKLMIDVPMGLQRHQIVGKLLGPRGGNVQFVEQDTGCRVKLVGREVWEMHEPLHFKLICESRNGIAAAKELLTNLTQTVLAEMSQYMQPMMMMPGYSPYGAPPPYGAPGYGAPMPPQGGYYPPAPPPPPGGPQPQAPPGTG